MKTTPKATAIISALVSMICVQGGASVAKKLFPILGATGTTSLRIGLSAVLLNIINKPKISKFTKQEWFYCFLYGSSIALMNTLFYLAIQRIPLGLAVTIEFIGPLVLALALSRKLLDILWALLAALGILLIVPWKTNDIDILGLACAFSAGIFWACYILMGSKVSKVMNTNDAVSVGLVFATIIVVPIALFTGGLENLSINTFLLGLLVAVLSSALPFSLDLLALKNLPAKAFSILTSLQPAFGALSGLLFLGEHLTLLQYLSILCVVLASVGTTAFSKNDV